MPTRSLKVDAVSPIVAYSGTWVQGNQGQEGQYADVNLYDDETYIISCTAGDSLHVNFYGYEVELFGFATNGNYSIFLDTQQTESQDLEFAPSSIFRRSLYQATLLNDEPHDLTIRINGGCFALDYLTWSTISSSTADLKLEDTNQAHMEYDETWSTDISGLGSFSHSSGHVSMRPDSELIIYFSGPRIELYGPVGNFLSSYMVELDSDETSATSFNFTTVQNSTVTAQKLLYVANGLSFDDHRLLIRRNATESTSPIPASDVFALDYMILDAAYNHVNIRSGYPYCSNNYDIPLLTPPQIVGITIGVDVVLLSILSWIMFIFLRRRMNRAFSKQAAISPRTMMREEASVYPLNGPSSVSWPSDEPTRTLTFYSSSPRPYPTSLDPTSIDGQSVFPLGDGTSEINEPIVAQKDYY